jgi:hypothetical protein
VDKQEQVECEYRYQRNAPAVAIPLAKKCHKTYDVVRRSTHNDRQDEEGEDARPHFIPAAIPKLQHPANK